MAIALIKIDNKIKEIYGKQYINLHRLDSEIIEEIKVSENISTHDVNILGVKREVVVIKDPIDDICYYKDYLNISRNSKYFIIRNLNKEEFLKIDNSNKKLINNSSLNVYKNYDLMNSQEFEINIGDVIHIDYLVRIIIKEENIIEIKIFDKRVVTSNLPSFKGIKKEYKDLPIYTNSPKRNYTLESENIELKLPPEREKKQKFFDILRRLLPMIVTFSLTMLLAYIKPRGPYIIISASATVMAVTFTIISFIRDKKENKKFNEKRKEIYEEYLYETRTELNKKKLKEIKIRNYKHLSYNNIMEEIENNTSRLYERSFFDEDFLSVRIGVFNDKPLTYIIKNPVEDLKIEKEAAEHEIEELYEDFKELEDVPRVISLTGNNIGMIGSRSIIKEQTFSYITQLMFFQSYLDIKIIYVIEENEIDDYKAYGYARHSQLGKERNYSFIYDTNTRDGILPSIMQEFRKRQEKIENKDFVGTIFIFVISNYSLISNHPIMEFLNKSPSDYGFCLLFQSEREENLIKNIQTVLNFKNKYVVEVLSENGVVKNEDISIESKNDYDIEYHVRKLGQLEHIKGIQSAIPNSINFLELHNVEKVEDLNIESEWGKNKAHKSMSALIGKKSETDYVYLDLHEKAHGPHGIMGGTTGSGKSELFQTIILSLMIKYSPHEISFLIIDYKGGGMANLFEDAPHTLGTITNLDGYQVTRALDSLNSEGVRRQRIFAKYGVNHIDDYMKLFEKGEADEPLPHIIISGDEVAEAKEDQPEFMKGINSLGRIGRSLGMHLILGTQKPAGVVDDQMLANSKFRISLKVATESDSNELLKTPDAAFITQPGRGYLKVGTDELYELFQSGYTGAGYSDNNEEHRDLRVFILDQNGNKILVNKDDEKVKVDVDENELGAVLSEIKKVYKQQDFIPVKKTWMPPLEDSVELKKNILNLDKQELNLSIDIGIIDVPTKQEQYPLELNLIEDGNVGVFGSIQSGKTTTIKSILLSLAQQNSPKNLKIYILDYGNNGLIGFKGLKHTADYLTIDDETKVSRMIKELRSEMKDRSEKFANVMAANFKSYNELSKEKLEAILIVIDNLDAIRDVDISELDVYTTLLKEGPSLGIFVIVSATKISTLKGNQSGAISKVIQHYTQDKGEITASLGKRSDYDLLPVAGRVQVKLDKPEVAQVYTPIKADTEKDIVLGIQNYIKDINENTSYENDALVEMPESVIYDKKYNKKEEIFIGIDYENILPQYVKYSDFSIVGDSEYTSKFIETFIEQSKDEISMKILDSNNMLLYDKVESEDIPYFTENNIEEFIEIIEKESEKHQEEYEIYKKENDFIIPKKYFDSKETKYIIFNDVNFLQSMDILVRNKFMSMVSVARSVNFKLILNLNEGKGMDDLTKLGKSFDEAIILFDPRDQFIKTVNKMLMYEEGDLYYAKGNKFIRLKNNINELN